LVASKVLNEFAEDILVISDGSRQATIDWLEREGASMSEVEEEESAKRCAWLESGPTSLSLSLGPVVNDGGWIIKPSVKVNSLGCVLIDDEASTTEDSTDLVRSFDVTTLVCKNLVQRLTR
jgi:hypothetical protein